MTNEYKKQILNILEINSKYKHVKQPIKGKISDTIMKVAKETITYIDHNNSINTNTIYLQTLLNTCLFFLIKKCYCRYDTLNYMIETISNERKAFKAIPLKYELY